ncbi:MAG TPA: PilZ domain-containing protein [Phycisphaerae bacterium]|nr:PilZ domain-containing protein [Phycisphaerae bacterium]HUU22295.1 PilZ domain-containing protein [Phycisphaerae bacterium]
MDHDPTRPRQHVSARDRRREERIGTSGAAVMRDSQQRFIARCLATNVSSKGVFLMTHDVPGLPREGQIYVEMELPAGAVPPTVESRTVHLCRIIRVKQLGKLVGIGVELLERLQ